MAVIFPSADKAPKSNPSLRLHMSYSIRKSSLSDLPALLLLAEAARGIMRRSGNMGQWVDGYPSAEVFRADIERGVSYLMLDESSMPVATFAFMPGPDPTYAQIFDDRLPDGSLLQGAWVDDVRPYAVVHRIASRPEAHGVMAALLDFCFRRSPNLRIDTHRDNVIMQHLMQRHGFTRCGIIYLTNGDERLAYQKILYEQS